MPNILLTNTCNQRCPYCFAANKITRDSKNRGSKEMSLKDLKTVLDFLERNNERVIRLMGGEPTLHSKFEEIVDYILSRNLRIHVFTNGLFSAKKANLLVRKGQKIKYSFNINPPSAYSSRRWNQILENLGVITSLENCLIGAVIWQENFNIDYLIDLANRYPVKAIMLRVANPVFNQKNKYVSLNRYPTLAKNIIREIKKADESKIRIGFGCGLAKNMFSPEEIHLLKKYNVANMKWGCDGNSGRFDISVNLSVFRCFPLSGWQEKKLLDFNNSQEIENYFNRLMKDYQSRNSETDFIHQGPCFAHCLAKK